MGGNAGGAGGTATGSVFSAFSNGFTGSNGVSSDSGSGGTGATGITATVEGTDSTVYVEEGFNIVGNGWLYLPVPEERIGLINTTLGLKFPTAPTSAGWISGQEWIEFAS